MMRRIAVIGDGFARDAMLFTGDPATISEDGDIYDPDWEDKYVEVKNTCLFVGVFEGASEDEIKKIAAEQEGCHSDIISLIAEPPFWHRGEERPQGSGQYFVAYAEGGFGAEPFVSGFWIDALDEVTYWAPIPDVPR